MLPILRTLTRIARFGIGEAVRDLVTLSLHYQVSSPQWDALITVAAVLDKVAIYDTPARRA